MDNSSEGTNPKSTGFKGKRTKRKYGKNLGNKSQPSNRKKSRQDLQQARVQLGLPSSANHAQISHAIQPAKHSERKCHSPPKRVLKVRLAKQAESIHALTETNLSLEYELATTTEQLDNETRNSQNAIKNATKVAKNMLAEAEGKLKEANTLREQTEADYANQKSEDRRKKGAQIEQYKEKLKHTYENKLSKIRKRYDEDLGSVKNRLVILKAQLTKHRKKYEAHLAAVELRLIRADGVVVEAKREYRKMLNDQLLASGRKEAELEQQIRDLNELSFELADEVKDAKRQKRIFEKRADRSRESSNKRKRKVDDLKEENEMLRDENIELHKTTQQLVDDIKINEDRYRNLMPKRTMKKVRVKGKRGGGKMWDIWVVQMCCELLVCGASPAAIPDIIDVMYATLYEGQPIERPSINWIRQCRVIVQVMAETIAAWKLASKEKWPFMCTDATTRAQLEFQAVVVGMFDEEGDLDPVTVSSCIWLKDGESSAVADTIEEKVRV